MTSTDRLFLFIISIALGVVGLTLMASVLGAMDRLLSSLTYLADKAKWETFTVSAVVVVASIYLLALALRTRGERGVSKETALGSVRISLRAVESLVLRAASQVKGVRDVQPSVRPVDGGLTVLLDATVMPDVSIPDVVEELQMRVSEYVQSSVGMAVIGVKVNVRGLSIDGKARVE